MQKKTTKCQLAPERSKDGMWVSVLFFLVKKIVAPLVRFFWIKKVTGVENIPETGPVIIAFNHSSYFDFLAFLAVSPRHVHYLAAEKFYSSSFWKPIMEKTQQIKVCRTQKDKREVFKQVYNYLEEGCAVGIFPEGTRAPSEHLLPAFGGIVRFASKTGVPIVPVGIIGAFSVMSRFHKIPRLGKKIEIIVDKPQIIVSSEGVRLNKRGFQFFADSIMLRIANLIGKTYNFKTFKKKKEYTKVAVFDIDGTLVEGQSQRYLLEYLYGRKLISKLYFYKVMSWFVLYRLGIVKNPKKIMEYSYSFLKGKNEDSINKLLELFVNEELSQHFYKEGKNLVARQKMHKKEVFFISNMPEILLKHIAEYYDVKNYYGTKIEIDKDGNYTGKIVGEIVYGIEKTHALYTLLSKGNYTLKGSWGYADHISDVFLLAVLGNPVVINPNPKMATYATKKKWTIKFIN